MADKYFIKAGYQENAVPLTDDRLTAGNYWNRSRLRNSRDYQFPVYRFAAKMIRDIEARIVIDVGCGPATKMAMLHQEYPEIAFTGIDLPSAIAFCQKNYDWGTWIADSIESPTQLHRITPADVVICSDVIKHLLNPDRLLDYLRAVTRPSALVVMSTPERDSLHGKDRMSCPNPYHVREWSFGEFEAYLLSRGLTVLSHCLQHPMRYRPNFPTIWQVGTRLLTRRPFKWNQVCLLRLG